MTEPTPKEFTELLIKNDRGRTEVTASQALIEVVAAVLETGKAGTVSLTFKVAVNDVDDRRLVITGIVKSNPPTPDPKSAIWYADAENHLTREDPKQDPLFGAPRIHDVPLEYQPNHPFGDDAA